MKIGIYPGTFNPVHKGHKAVARFMSRRTDLDRVWVLVSPQNPFKDKSAAPDAAERFRQVRRAFSGDKKILVSNFELKLPVPTYTYRTLRLLRKKFPKHEFVLILGADSMQSLPRWKNGGEIIRKHAIYVYPRKGTSFRVHKGRSTIKLFKAAKVNVSSTAIRQGMKQGKKMQKWLA